MARKFLWQWPLLLQFALLLRSTEPSPSVPTIIVFGDSTVDPGNNNYIPTMAKADFPPYGRDFYGGVPTGRFCNGRLATDFLSEALGLPKAIPAYLDPDYGIEELASGASFASAATGYDNLTASSTGVLPLWKQLGYFQEFQGRLGSYLGEAKAQKTLTEALYVVSMGTNDFLGYYSTIRSSQFSVSQYEDFIVGIARRLAGDLCELGARKLVLIGLPPFGCVPEVRYTNSVPTGTCTEEYNRVAIDYNSRLQGAVEELKQELPGLQIVYGDIYTVLLAAIQNPASFGFENAVKGCCGTGVYERGPLCNEESLLFTCPDASKYVFWDAIHPTEAMYRLVADRLLSTDLSVFF